LVLLVAEARLFARRFAYWPICDGLRSISPRDEYAGADLSVTVPMSLALVGVTCARRDRSASIAARDMSFDREGKPIRLPLLPLCFPENKMTRPPKGGLSEVIQITRKSGAGEGARTLDPDLGKVVLLLQRLAACDRSGL
jgi:hypothetical protein